MLIQSLKNIAIFIVSLSSKSINSLLNKTKTFCLFGLLAKFSRSALDKKPSIFYRSIKSIDFRSVTGKIQEGFDKTSRAFSVFDRKFRATVDPDAYELHDVFTNRWRTNKSWKSNDQIHSFDQLCRFFYFENNRTLKIKIMNKKSVYTWILL